MGDLEQFISTEDKEVNFNGPQHHNSLFSEVFKSIPKYMSNLWKHRTKKNTDTKAANYETQKRVLADVVLRLEQLQEEYQVKLSSNASIEEVTQIQAEMTELNKKQWRLEESIKNYESQNVSDEFDFEIAEGDDFDHKVNARKTSQEDFFASFGSGFEDFDYVDLDAEEEKDKDKEPTETSTSTSDEIEDDLTMLDLDKDDSDDLNIEETLNSLGDLLDDLDNDSELDKDGNKAKTSEDTKIHSDTETHDKETYTQAHQRPEMNSFIQQAMDSINEINDMMAKEEAAKGTNAYSEEKEALRRVTINHRLSRMEAPEEMLEFNFDSMVLILNSLEPKIIDGVCCPFDKETGKIIPDENVQIQMIVGLLWYKAYAYQGKKGTYVAYKQLFNDFIHSMIQYYFTFGVIDIDKDLIEESLKEKGHEDLTTIHMMLNDEETQILLKRYVARLAIENEIGSYEKIDEGLFQGVSFS